MKRRKEDALSQEMFSEQKPKIEPHDDMAPALEKERDNIARASYEHLLLRHGITFERDLSRAVIHFEGRTEYWRRIEDDEKKKSKKLMYEKVE